MSDSERMLSIFGANSPLTGVGRLGSVLEQHFANSARYGNQFAGFAEMGSLATRWSTNWVDHLNSHQEAFDRAANAIVIPDVADQFTRLAEGAAAFARVGSRIRELSITRIIDDMDRHREALDTLTGVAFSNSFINSVSWLESLSSRWSCLARPSFLQEYARIEPEYEHAMVEACWPPLSEVPLRIVFSVVQVYNEEGVEALRSRVDQIVVRYYDGEALRSLLESWKQVRVLGDRFKIFEEIIQCHESGCYAASVSLCVAQMEGVVAVGSGHTGALREKGLKALYASLLGETHSKELAESLMRFVFEPLYGFFKWGGDVPAGVSRHAILHGASTDYGSEVNSLKAILILNHLIKLLAETEY